MSFSSGAAGFPATQGSAVLGAASTDPAVRERSWQALAAAYWKPAYKHVRVKWKAPAAQAEDYVQGFFERALEPSFFEGYDAAQSRFRTFFKVCLDRHVSNATRDAQREKRGGPLAALDFAGAENELERQGAAAWESPDAVFDREWKRQLFTAAIAALQQRCEREDKRAAWEAFSRYDLAEPPRPRYDDLAKQLSLPVTTVTNHLSWARRTLREEVHAQLQQLTATDRELLEEATAAGVPR